MPEPQSEDQWFVASPEEATDAGASSIVPMASPRASR